MAGVGDKTLLLVVALCDRLYDAAGKIADETEDDQQSGQRHDDAGSQELPELRKRCRAVEEGDARHCPFVGHRVSVLVDPAAFAACLEGFFGVPGRR